MSGDVVLAHNATVGKVGLYRGEYERAIVGTSLTIFRPNLERILPEFLFAALRARDFQSQLTKNMGQTTRNQVPAQRSLKFPIPNIKTQELFAQKAVAIEATRAYGRAHLAKLDALFASYRLASFAANWGQCQRHA
jgi:type I restriction enzyme S subunit